MRMRKRNCKKRMLAGSPVLKSPLERCFDLDPYFRRIPIECNVFLFLGNSLSAASDAEFAVNVDGVSGLQVRVQAAMSVDICS